jgi:hypothetical protein
MYEKIKYFDTEIVLKAINSILESDNKTFPALGQLISACRERRAEYEKIHPPESKERGCIRCYCGSVYYIKDNKPVGGHCAICYNGESRSYPGFYLQVENRIYTAYREQGSMFVADPKSRGNVIPYKPHHTNEWLEQCYSSPMFKDMPIDTVKKIMQDNPLTGVRLR